jgi:hypothetical protein
MNTRTALSKIRDFKLGPRFDRYRTLIDMSSYMQKQQDYALSSKFLRAVCCVLERTTHPTNEQLLNNWVKVCGSTVFALFYRHD